MEFTELYPCSIQRNKKEEQLVIPAGWDASPSVVMSCELLLTLFPVQQLVPKPSELSTSTMRPK